MKIRLFVLSFACLLALHIYNIWASAPIDSLAGNPGKGTLPHLRSYLTDTRAVALAPLTWTGKEWAGFGLVCGVTAILIPRDEQINAFIRDRRTAETEWISANLFEPWGNYYSLATLGLFLLDGSIRNNIRSRETALLGLKAYIISGLVVRVPKVLAGRHRPYQDSPPDAWSWEGPSFRYSSFASGHTTSVFAVATVVAGMYREQTWVGTLAYSLAGLTALSRVHDEKHWASDVLAGAALGYATGKFVVKKHGGTGTMIIPGPEGATVVVLF